MSQRKTNFVEKAIINRAKEKAQELGIEFRVKHSVKDGMDDVLVRIKRDFPKDKDSLNEEELAHYKAIQNRQNEFADFIGNIILGIFSYTVRFKYPRKF